MNPLHPKLPSIITGRERYRSAAAVTAARTALGLGTMATQNNSSVNITGGNVQSISNLSASNGTITSIATSYISGASGYFSGAVSIVDLTAGKLDNNGTTGLQAEFMTASGVIPSNATIVLLDPSAAACTGTPSTTACSTYTNSTNCTARDSHGGCTWNTIYCYTWNGDESGCNANSGYGCTWESASCSGVGAYDESSCTSYSGCSWNNNPQPCSGFGDYGTCTSYSGCYWYDEQTSDCSAFNGDQSTCEGTSGCSWDYMDMTTCSGTYVSTPAYCDGSYDSYSCDGTYYTGACTGSGGYCSGTATCQGIDDSTNCNAETGCSWSTVVNATLPAVVNDRVYFLKNIGNGGNDAVIYPDPTGTPTQTIEGASSYTLADDDDGIMLVGKVRTGSCSGYGDESTCNSHYGCGWSTSDCGGFSDETSCTEQSGCSWDGMYCSGSYGGACGGTETLSRNWYVLTSHGI